VVLVTSAAVGTGLRRLNMAEKPKQFSSSIQVKQVKISL
jgi:glutamate 5-kinase